MGLWHSIGLVTVAGGFLLKERLSEGLQFRVDSFASKLHLGAIGKDASIPSAGLLVHGRHQFVVQQMYSGHLLCARHCWRPWKYS